MTTNVSFEAAFPPPDENMEPQMMASELHNVRLKLEEKRRRIESEKRKMEQMLSKQKEKTNKEAFMQAVVKGVSTNPLCLFVYLDCYLFVI